MRLENKYDEQVKDLQNQLDSASREISNLKEMINVLKAFQEHTNIDVTVNVRWVNNNGRYESVGCFIDKGAFHLIQDCVKHSENEKEKAIDFILGVKSND